MITQPQHICLSDRARASISFRDLGSNEVASLETGYREVERNVAVCANIGGETWPIWFVETIGM